MKQLDVGDLQANVGVQAGANQTDEEGDDVHDGLPYVVAEALIDRDGFILPRQLALATL